MEHEHEWKEVRTLANSFWSCACGKTDYGRIRPDLRQSKKVKAETG